MCQTREEPLWASEIELFQKTSPKSLYLLYFLGSLDEVPFPENVVNFYCESHRLSHWINIKNESITLKPEAKDYLTYYFNSHRASIYFQETCAKAIAALVPVIVSSLATYTQNDNLFHHAKRLLKAYDNYVVKTEPLIMRALSTADFETLRNVLALYCKLYPDIEADIASPTVIVPSASDANVDLFHVTAPSYNEMAQTPVTFITSEDNALSRIEPPKLHTLEKQSEGQIVPHRRQRSSFFLGSLGFFGASVLSIYALVNRNNPNFFFNHFFASIKDNAVRAVTGFKK